MGLNLELLASREACKSFPAHLPTTDSHVYHTALTKMRPNLSPRLLLQHLYRDRLTRNTVDALLQAIFILPEIQTKRGYTAPWTALFIWEAYCPGIDPSVCQQLAACTPQMQPLQIATV